jgi:hypothetical protein
MSDQYKPEFVGREILPGFVAHVRKDVQPETMEALQETGRCLMKMIEKGDLNTMTAQTLRERVDWLTNTSVDDMRSSLDGYGLDDLAVLHASYKRCKRRGEKTKAKILASKIKQLGKQQGVKVKEMNREEKGDANKGY